MFNSKFIRFWLVGAALLAFVLAGPDARAQEKKDKYKGKYDREFCSNGWSNGDRYGARDLRETTVAGRDLTVDGKRNGGITVRGEDRADVLVRACVQTWAGSQAEADALAKQIRIETNGTIRAEGLDDDRSWGVSFEIRVPRSTNLQLKTLNGGIAIENVEGAIEFDAKNGGIHLKNLAGDVRGRTTNGGVHVELSGGAWRGAGLSVETTNGGVHLSMPQNYAARFETRTVNGGFKSDIPGLAVEKEKDDNGYYRRPGVDITRDLNGGGAPVRVVTTNGGVMIEAN